jgi:hypothetical protein
MTAAPAIFIALTLLSGPGQTPAPPRIVAGFVGSGAAQACAMAAEDIEAQARASGVVIRVRCLWTSSV